MSNPTAALRFDEIYSSTHKAVRAFITAKCRRTADINDIFQDTYTELYMALCKRGADYVTHEKAFVLRIARNRLAKYLSLAERLRMFVSASATDENGDEIDLTEAEADAFLTEEIAVNKILLKAAQDFILQKPERVKKVFYLYYDVGLTIREVAEELSVSESYVKNKLYRTVKDLKNLLNEGA
jgi:RNA polymerase sigma-70 factor (ECF subfamily)